MQPEHGSLTSRYLQGLPFAKTARSIIYGGKVWSATPVGLFQTGLKVWFFARFVLRVRHFRFVNYVACHGKICILKQAILLVLYQYCILHIFYGAPVSPDHHKIHNANCLFSILHSVSFAKHPISDTHFGNIHAFVCASAQKQTV